MLLNRILNYFSRKIMGVYYSIRLSHFGCNSRIVSPLHIFGGGIYIGSNVIVNYKSWLASLPHTGESESKLIIKDGCTVGNFNEIYATKLVVLEKNVLTADRVYISDNLHGYEDPLSPVLHQPIVQNKTVRIGEGSWLGVGVAVMGANIGKHCVIGANAVVTKDIPDYSVAVGIPAKVIKRYNSTLGKWERTNPDGSFKN